MKQNLLEISLLWKDVYCHKTKMVFLDEKSFKLKQAAVVEVQEEQLVSKLSH